MFGYKLVKFENPFVTSATLRKKIAYYRSQGKFSERIDRFVFVRCEIIEAKKTLQKI